MLNENSVFEMMSVIAKTHADSYTKLFPMASIWVSEHRRKYSVGDTVIVKEGKLVNSQGIYTTHEIMKLEGLLNDSKHVFTVRDMVTDELLKIDL